MMTIMGGWLYPPSTDSGYYEKVARLNARIRLRRSRWPDPKFNMIKINNKWNDIEVMTWLLENTTGKFYISQKRIGFMNEQEALMFSLRFN